MFIFPKWNLKLFYLSTSFSGNSCQKWRQRFFKYYLLKDFLFEEKTFVPQYFARVYIVKKDGTPFWPKVEISWWKDEILLRTVEIFMMNGRDFIMNGQDFHDERSRFSWWTDKILLRAVEIFMMNGRDFHVERSRFSWWTAQIFTMDGRDFHDEWFRFSWWQVMTGRDFHNDRSEIALLFWLKSRSARGASGHPSFSFYPRVTLIYLVDGFLFFLLK